MKKIAIFKTLGEHPYESVCEDWAERVGGYVRLTEYLEVEFQPLRGEEVVQQQLAVLDKAESELRTKFQSALNGIEQQRAELRAITHKPARTPNDCLRCGDSSCRCDIASNE